MHRSFPLLAILLTASVSTAEPQVITIKTLRAQMRYDVTDFTVKPGDDVKIVLDNVDDMPHNLLIYQPGTDVLELAAKLMDKPEAAAEDRLRAE